MNHTKKHTQHRSSPSSLPKKICFSLFSKPEVIVGFFFFPSSFLLSVCCAFLDCVVSIRIVVLIVLVETTKSAPPPPIKDVATTRYLEFISIQKWRSLSLSLYKKKKYNKTKGVYTVHEERTQRTKREKERERERLWEKKIDSNKEICFFYLYLFFLDG